MNYGYNQPQQPMQPNPPMMGNGNKPNPPPMMGYGNQPNPPSMGGYQQPPQPNYSQQQYQQPQQQYQQPQQPQYQPPRQQQQPQYQQPQRQQYQQQPMPNTTQIIIQQPPTVIIQQQQKPQAPQPAPKQKKQKRQKPQQQRQPVAPQRPQHIPQQQQPSDEIALLKQQNAQLMGRLDKIEYEREYQPLERKLMAMQRSMIKQKFDKIEFIAGGEKGNVYKCYPMIGAKKEADSQLIFQEQSSWCSRKCLSADCRPMKISCVNKQNAPIQDEKVLELVRPYKCTMFCCGRPSMEVKWVEKGRDETIGFVYDPWDICNYTVSCPPLPLSSYLLQHHF